MFREEEAVEDAIEHDQGRRWIVGQGGSGGNRIAAEQNGHNTIEDIAVKVHCP